MSENQSFHWCQIAKAGEKTHIEFPPDMTLSISNICIGKYKESEIGKPVRLFAHAKVIDLTKENETNENIKFTETKSLIASFIPGESEFLHSNIIFSPFNDVYVEVEGNVDVHLSGILDIMYDFEEEDQIEQKFKEEEDHEDV